MKKLNITETKNVTATAVGAEAILFEMLAYAFKEGLFEGKTVEFTSSYFHWIDEITIYDYNDEGIKTLIERAKSEGIRLSADVDNSGVTGIQWTMELIND